MPELLRSRTVGSIPLQRETTYATDEPSRPPGAPAVVRTSLPGNPLAPAAARRFVRGALADWAELGLTATAGDGDRLTDDAVVVLSELVTNAVVHAGTNVELLCRLETGHPDDLDGGCAPAALVIEVSDHHPARAVRSDRTDMGPDTPECGARAAPRGLPLRRLGDHVPARHQDGLGPPPRRRRRAAGRRPRGVPGARTFQRGLRAAEILAPTPRRFPHDQDWINRGALSFLAEASDLLGGTARRGPGRLARRTDAGAAPRRLVRGLARRRGRQAGPGRRRPGGPRHRRPRHAPPRPRLAHQREPHGGAPQDPGEGPATAHRRGAQRGRPRAVALRGARRRPGRRRARLPPQRGRPRGGHPPHRTGRPDPLPRRGHRPRRGLRPPGRPRRQRRPPLRPPGHHQPHPPARPAALRRRRRSPASSPRSSTSRATRAARAATSTTCSPPATAAGASRSATSRARAPRRPSSSASPGPGCGCSPARGTGSPRSSTGSTGSCSTTPRRRPTPRPARSPPRAARASHPRAAPRFLSLLYGELVPTGDGDALHPGLRRPPAAAAAAARRPGRGRRRAPDAPRGRRRPRLHQREPRPPRPATASCASRTG